MRAPFFLRHSVEGRRGMADGRLCQLVCNALKVRVASLNLIGDLMGSQWSCLRSSVDVSDKERGNCCVTTLSSVCCAR